MGHVPLQTFHTTKPEHVVMDDIVSLGDPAMALLHKEVAACESFLNTIADAIPSLDDERWYGTTRHEWDEERSRFILWRNDLSRVIAELYDRSPPQAIKIASSNILPNLRDLAGDLNEVLLVVDGHRLPLDEPKRSGGWTTAGGNPDEQDTSELVERLGAVSSTVSGLARMLKFQYSYALSSAEDDEMVRKDSDQDVARTAHKDRPGKGAVPPTNVLQTENGPRLPRYGAAPMSYRRTGLWEPSMTELGSRVPKHEISWMLPDSGAPDPALDVMQRKTSVLHPGYTESVDNRFKQDWTPRNWSATQVDMGDKPLPSPQSTLNSDGFKFRTDKFFQVGRVLMVLWIEPEGSSAHSSSIYSYPAAYGERASAKIRRFIVVKKNRGHVLAVPILSSRGLRSAISKDRRDDHAIVHMGPVAPQPPPSAWPLRGQSHFLYPSIRVVPDNPTEKLKDFSIIDFGKIYTIEANLECKGVGMVHVHSLPFLLEHHLQVIVGRSQGLAGISEEQEASEEKERHAVMEMGPAAGNSDTPERTTGRAVQVRTPAPTLHSARPKNADQGSDSGYGISRAATEYRSVAESVVDENSAEYMEEDEELGPWRVLMYVDAQKPEVPVLDPDNPTSEQLQALSESSIQILVDSLLAEQQSRLQLRSTQG